MQNFDLFQAKIPSTINIKSKYIKSLRFNNLYFQPKSKRKTESKKNIEKYIFNKLLKAYAKPPNFYNVRIINEIVANQKSHIVAEFKDYLIKDDCTEFFWKFYTKKESYHFLIKILNYYKQTSVVFPNYILLTENKYLYKNIQRKQKLINILEEKDDAFSNCKRAGYDTDDFFDIYSKVFNSRILDSILNESETSQIKKSLFGISTENSNNFTDTDNKMNNLVNNINKIEENCRQEFLFGKKLINNENKITKKDILIIKDNIKNENNNLINSKKIKDNKFNNKNVIISRNRHQIVEISKYSKFTKDESRFKNIKKKAKTSISKDLKNNSIILKIINRQRNKRRNNSFVFKNENNKNIIFNNIYTTDLYLNINNNIIIKETKNKSHDKKNYKNYFKNAMNKLDLKKLKNLGILKESIHSDGRKNKHLKKNYINNLLLSINSFDKESCRYSQKSDSERENKFNKNILEKEKQSSLEINFNKSMKHKNNRINIIIKNLNKSKNKNDTSRTYYKKEKQNSANLEAKKYNKNMINQFKNTLNNLMSGIFKKNDIRNIKTKHYNIRNYKDGYSGRFSSFINKKEKKSIESYYDSIKSINNNSIKTKRRIHKMNKENLTSRSYISEKSKLALSVQDKYNKKKKITNLNIKKFENITKEFDLIQKESKTKKIKKKEGYLIGELISLNKYNHNKKKELFSLTWRESYKNIRNRTNKNSKINYTSFIKSNNNRFKAYQNPINYILFRRPKSLPNKKEYIRKILDSKGNRAKINHIVYNKNIRKKSNDKSLKERIKELNITDRNKRSFQKNQIVEKYNSQMYSSLSHNFNKNINNTKVNKKIDIKKIKEIHKYINNDAERQKSNTIIYNKIKKYKGTYSDKINKNKNISYTQIELRNKNYIDIYNNRKKYNIINNNRNKLAPFFYTDRLYQKK